MHFPQQFRTFRIYRGDTRYFNVQLGDFISGLVTVVKPRSYLNSHPVESRSVRGVFIPEESKKLSALRLYERLNTFLDDRMVLLAEPGDAFCAALDFNIEESENFIVQAYYSSIGYCTPAALGVAFARPGKRPVVLTGDGAFQMTAQEISTLIRQRCPAIICIINNDGYLVERVLHEDGPYNDIQMWNYADLPAAFGGGDYAVGIKVTTEGDLERALVATSVEDDKLFLIELCLPDRDCSAGLKQLGDTFRQMVPVLQASK
jgi:indolepyruvate decarboxylase